MAFIQGQDASSDYSVAGFNDIPYRRIITNTEPPTAGWELVFDEPYNYAVSTQDLRFLAMKCNSKILVGARRVNGSTLIVAASGPSCILQLETKFDGCSCSGSCLRTVKFYNVWWYLAPNYSFGFAPSARLLLNDFFDSTKTEDPEYQLSWWLDNSSGGYRAGAYMNIANSMEYRMLIYCQ